MNTENKLIIEWVDDGWGGKNWFSPWGVIGLEQRPSYCNRGRVQFKTVTEGYINRIFNPLLSGAYFFDKQRALDHLGAVVRLANSIDPAQLKDLKIESMNDDESIELVDCKCRLSLLQLLPVGRKLVMLDVEVSPESLDTFVVDFGDGFPRVYCDYDLAFLEMNDWIIARNQRKHHSSGIGKQDEATS